ncbi:hypothetical protein [Paenibacillus aurantiacus]|uniref:hypothetical protein n=1 Tax=Paenibacillus aurantiacus TaxID=1936118 RepID=UPI00366AC597
MRANSSYLPAATPLRRLAQRPALTAPVRGRDVIGPAGLQVNRVNRPLLRRSGFFVHRDRIDYASGGHFGLVRGES